MKVFVYRFDGVITEEDADVNLDPNNPGSSYCVRGNSLYDTNKEHLRQWALNVESADVTRRLKWVEDCKRALECVQNRVTRLTQ